MTNWLIENPPIIALLGAVCLVVIMFIKEKWSVIKGAKYIAEKGQFQILRMDVIDEAIKDAKRRGFESEFMELLRMIRRKHGHDGIRVGHLYWIWHQIEQSDDDLASLEIPSFKEKEHNNE